ncbi:MAG: hypothetical protein COT71_03205 [Candidatus Andersenbacteria bacterium CG10_big_fil_rev_8_21_14_0_10_54_11]|uniref:Uncharacterized protein n=1 Tax=Candidatus Andersenbacteria bacterium CG10_big_fil_rev_8_21_14_0_10_54_11 TaxID=1974485 RepID=A0A2M6WYT1_9BACT|nr:MAG: hypothetical protein COT71_03205 [Candidatus Andersenbacteria bacterium CG10_big_fil_rev_8_21_14_0_10_54_11]
MARKPRSLEQRRKQIMKVAGTSYHSSDDASVEYLAAIEGADLDEQHCLFQTVLSVHDARLRREQQCPTKRSIKSKEWRVAAKRLAPMVRGWSRTATRNNASLTETAHSLWEQLTLYEGNDWAIAFGLLLDQPMVPYAQVLGMLTLVRPLDVYESAHDRILGKVALLYQVAMRGASSVFELAEALEQILQMISQREERVVLLAEFMDQLMRCIRQQGDASDTLADLVGRAVLLGPFRFNLDDADTDTDGSDLDAEEDDDD